jgi:uncharacterized protein YndB with AHSA1/START domain
VKTIKQSYYINATPEEVYRAITNPFTIELWSGLPANMELTEGSEFYIFDGDICGRNIKLTENLQLVQEWYFGDSQEESIVTINLKPHKTGTRVFLEHIHVPDDVADEFEEGWKNYYWGALKEFFR